MRRFSFLLSLSCLATSLTACQPRIQGNLSNSLPGQGTPLQAQNTESGLIDDSDLSGGFRPQVAAQLESEVLQTLGNTQIFATQTQATPQMNAQGAASLSGQLRFVDRKGETQAGAMARVDVIDAQGQTFTTETRSDGSWELNLPTTGQYQVRYRLENRYWQITNYAWEGPAVGVNGPTQAGITTLTPGSENAKAAWIHDVYLQSLALFAREGVPLDWWQRPIRTIWPGRGNYYTSYTINLTGAEQWDVNGHEIGHAIYHQALNAASRGGQHKIDDCYHDTLALSEGFASFFSAAVHLDKNDPDARFDQYLVPRRAPIRIENVPDDVCAGPANEWRVSSVFWDAYDTHRDGQDGLNLGLKTIFAALGRQDRPTARSVTDAYGLLKEALPASEHEKLAQIFRQNTMPVTP